jgi:benzoyl-CoA reductase/2-hydroxyglutaryl-CoA dehydratase subunit BcrC/BadD/HgdB
VDETSEEGSRSILYTCCYVPEEIILAAGFQPRRFLPEARPAEGYVHPNTCGYVKSLIASALESEAMPAAGIIIANSCDAMRRFYDLWSTYVPTTPAFFLDVPKKSDADSVAFFASELRSLVRTMEEVLPDTRVRDAELQGAIRTSNEIRSLMGEVFRTQRSLGKNVRGTEVFNLCLAATTHTTAEFAAEIRRFLDGVEDEKTNGTAQRFLLTGGLINRPELIAELESSGGRVAVLDTCIGLRHYERLVEEDSADPMLALARRYLMKPACARMQGFEERFRHVQGMAEAAGVDGVVFCALKFCDALVYDVPMMAQRFREIGIPFLWLEHDYAWSGLGRLKTEVAAFRELTG